MKATKVNIHRDATHPGDSSASIRTVRRNYGTPVRGTFKDAGVFRTKWPEGAARNVLIDVPIGVVALNEIQRSPHPGIGVIVESCQIRARVEQHVTILFRVHAPCER